MDFSTATYKNSSLRNFNLIGDYIVKTKYFY
jgi:hypothetical protein